MRTKPQYFPQVLRLLQIFISLLVLAIGLGHARGQTPTCFLVGAMKAEAQLTGLKDDSYVLAAQNQPLDVAPTERLASILPG
jgi:hypothetical protein